MKIRELHMQRYQHNQRHVTDPQDLYPMGAMNESMSGGSYGPPSAHQGPISMGMPDYVQSMNRQMMKGSPQMSMMPAYAVFPDVKFKDLPFYEVISELMRPSSLIPLMTERVHERDFVFYLSPQQIMDLDQNPDVQVQLRFCLLETSCEQDDEFPSSVCLKVNDKFANLPNVIPNNKPGLEQKRPRRPVDITSITNRSASEANHVTVSWASSNGRPYVVAVFLVRKHSASLLIRRLKANGVRNPDHTTAMIKEKLCQDRDSEIATMSLRGSLICPLGKVKMQLPSRALTCTHLQCFDATLYVQMNEKKPKWICPVCDKQALFKSLAIDGLFLDIVSKAPEDCTEVQFHEDGSWTPVIPLKKPAEIADATIDASPKNPSETEVKPKKNVQVFTLDSDSDTEDSWPVVPPKKKPCVRPASVISPVLLDSPENTQPLEAPSVSFDPNVPSTSKTNLVATASASGTVEEPINLDSGIEPIISTPLLSNTPSSSFGTVSSSNQPSAASDPNDSLEILDSAPNFDYYSLIQNTQEFDYPTLLENNSPEPDIISIDD
ncbi:E3 SUMO-protein ligase PIAS2-like [Uloborus diversus]|uniref:E3 SUMO-protein ligase PIAS2-like n=1 Tax=Uloborus diversus TaxID=327109 RepID=UPI00240A2640|nr:E3 SUMO-protein ligase PIAS2-like [Uloborus diversus]